MIKKIFIYRSFIFGSMKREFQLKYRNSAFGAIWTIINPMAMILVYTVIFSSIMKAKFPGAESKYAYSIYLCSGVILWGLFSEIVIRSVNIFIENSNLIKKISFPRICLPIIVIGNALVNFSIIFILFILFLLITGNFPGAAFTGIIPVLFILTIFSTGLGITLGVLNVFFRDVGQFVGVLMQFWFWLTPIVYSVKILPDSIHSLLALNPMIGPITAFQGIFIYGHWPAWENLWPTSIMAIIFCLSGLLLFRKHAGEMTDEL